MRVLASEAKNFKVRTTLQNLESLVPIAIPVLKARGSGARCRAFLPSVPSAIQRAKRRFAASRCADIDSTENRMSITQEEQIRETEGMLRASAISAGYPISGDGRVTEQDAASLLSYSRSQLKAMRAEGNGPRYYAVGMSGARISYRLQDLASWVEMARSSA